MALCETFSIGPWGLLAVMGATMASDTLNPPGPQATSPQSSIDQGDELEETMTAGQPLQKKNLTTEKQKVFLQYVKRPDPQLVKPSWQPERIQLSELQQNYDQMVHDAGRELFRIANEFAQEKAHLSCPTTDAQCTDECSKRIPTTQQNENQPNEDGYLKQLLLLLMMMPAFLQYKKSAVPEEPRQARNRQKLTTESVAGFCRQPQVTWSYPRSALVC